MGKTKPGNQRKSRTIRVRVTEGQYKLVADAASDAHLTMSALLLSSALKKSRSK
jgi:uncharacterized protein (DUF1778 family)